MRLFDALFNGLMRSRDVGRASKAVYANSIDEPKSGLVKWPKLKTAWSSVVDFTIELDLWS